MSLSFRPQKIKKFFYACAALLALLLLSIFLFRNFLLTTLIKSAENKCKSKYGFTLTVKDAGFNGISTVNLTNVLVRTSAGDSLFYSAETAAGINLVYLFAGKIRLKKLMITDMLISLNRRQGHDPLRLILGSKDKVNQSNSKTLEKDWGQLANKLLNRIFSSLPAETEFKNTYFNYYNDTTSTRWHIPHLKYHHRKFRASIIVCEEQNTNTWFTGALIDPSNRSASVMVYPGKTGKNNFPFLNTLFNLELGFDTLRLSLYPVTMDNKELHLSGEASMKNFRAKHWRMAPEDVSIQRASLFFSSHLGANTLSIDSVSRCVINQLEFRPSFSFLRDNHWKAEGSVNMRRISCNQFFSSLPGGIFSGFKGFKAQGTLAYKMNFSIDESQLDSLRFQSSLEAENFKISSYGQTNFSKINDVFMHTVYEKGQAVASFEVGPANPDYTPIDQISGYLQNAVLCSEDGDFYYHNGFNEKAFRKSIATNIREKKFKRGGSTISMQLVKNVFLTRNKTISRKLEEALTVWLIENRRLCSKERMLEVYLNIIEWGPGIYGISQAAKYYFNKKPADLELAESIFLAMIIPRPKWFYWNFDENGRLKSYTADYFRLIAGHLMRREIITEDQRNNLVPEIQLTGKAFDKLKIASTDSIPALLDPEEGMAEEN